MADGLFEILEIRSTRTFGILCIARRRGDALGRSVAIKVLSGTLVDNARVVSRARDEARLLSRLQHPNIVRVEELLSIQKRPVIVMEAIEGLSLRELLARKGRGLPAATVLEVVRRTARALEDAYAGVGTGGDPLRLVHRDIKPGNILLTVHGQVKVVDFELARGAVADRETTTVSTLVGTVGFIAPERYGDRAEGPEVDVYSLGVTLVAALAGDAPVLPLEASMYAETLDACLATLKPEGLKGPSSDRVRALVRRMCAYDPLDRPTHAEVQEEIRALQQHDPTLAPDLERYGAKVVHSMWESRTRLPPREDRAWLDVEFLESAMPDAIRPDTATPAPKVFVKADQKVREFLAVDGWETRKRELKWLLALEPGWTAEPFIEVLDRGVSRSWWKLWSKGPTNEQIAVALEVLKHRPNARVAEYGMRFAHHDDVRVAAAANVVISRASAEPP